MEQPTRENIFEMAAKRLRQDFEELRNVPHPGLRGGESENLVKFFLQEHLPRRFGVGAGFILDPFDKVSRQTDVIIYDGLNCPTYRASDTAAIFPSNNVAAVVEVKSKLDGKELKDALEKIQLVKSLAKIKAPEGPSLGQTHGSIFAFESALSLETVVNQYRDWLSSQGLGHHTDVICILDKAIIATVANVPPMGWAPIILEDIGPHNEGTSIGLGIMEFGNATLDVYFRLLLAHLILFRGIVDHPGFKWGKYLPKEGMIGVKYLTSITFEKDPEERKKKLKEYHDRAFPETPMPDDSFKK